MPCLSRHRHGCQQPQMELHKTSHFAILGSCTTIYMHIIIFKMEAPVLWYDHRMTTATRESTQRLECNTRHNSHCTRRRVVRAGKGM